MPEINPLTNDQIFLKKIAENTGSDYETGDVSEINPLTIDQIFLKEIAANTAGQSGDISELEGKVADNTAAIGLMENVLGAKNVLKYPYTDSTNTQGGLTFTDNGDGTVDVSGSETTGANVYFALENDISVTLGTKVSDIFPTAGKYTISCKNADGTNIYMSVYIADVGSFDHISEDGTDVEITNAMMSKTLRIHLEVKHDYVLSSAVTLKPMIRPAGTDSTYVPYAMTNRELTERVNERYISVVGDGVKTYSEWLSELYGLIDSSKISKNTILAHVYANNIWYFRMVHMSLTNYEFVGFAGYGGGIIYLTTFNLQSGAGSSATDIQLTANGWTITDNSSNKPSANHELRVYY